MVIQEWWWEWWPCSNARFEWGYTELERWYVHLKVRPLNILGLRDIQDRILPWDIKSGRMSSSSEGRKAGKEGEPYRESDGSTLKCPLNNSKEREFFPSPLRAMRNSSCYCLSLWNKGKGIIMAKEDTTGWLGKILLHLPEEEKKCLDSWSLRLPQGKELKRIWFNWIAFACRNYWWSLIASACLPFLVVDPTYFNQRDQYSSILHPTLPACHRAQHRNLLRNQSDEQRSKA